MNPLRRVYVSLMLAACWALPAGWAQDNSSASALQLYEKSLQEIAEQGRTPGEGKKAFQKLKERVAQPQFAQLNPARQYAWLHAMAMLGLQFNDFEYAHARAIETTGMPKADNDDWMVRFFSAAFTNRQPDALNSLLMLARKWPQSLAKYNDVYIASFVSESLRTAEPFDRRRLLDALFAAHWTLKGGLEPSAFWAELARMQLEQKDLDRAKETLVRITAPRSLLAMRADKRYEALVGAVPERFDIAAAIVRHDAYLKQLASALPRILSLRCERVLASVDAGQFEEAVKLADEILSAAPTAEDAAKSFDDAADQYSWVLDYRGQALQGLSKFAEAEKALKTAASVPEQGQPNVSNTLNLAYLYASIGRSRDALAVLGKYAKEGEGVSPYAQLQIQRVALRAALANKDAKATKAAVDVMRKNQAASPGTFQDALLDAGLLDEAAAFLIARLKEPSARLDALADVQDYGKVIPTAANVQLQKRWNALRARPDVQKAISEVGRVEQVPLAPPMR